ncbi:MAG: type II secretion system protein [Patescibacteria group bacterium]
MLKLQRGDTIIEVLLAFSIFSMLSVGAMTVMGQGTNASQRALEITLVRQQIDAQAEALRAAHQADTGTTSTAPSPWDEISVNQDTDVYTGYDTACPDSAPDDSFIMDSRDGTFREDGTWFRSVNTSTTLPYSHVDYSSGEPVAYGLWIEREFLDGGATLADSYSFTVQACWIGAGLETPLHIETVVRLYEPGS